MYRHTNENIYPLKSKLLGIRNKDTSILILI